MNTLNGNLYNGTLLGAYFIELMLLGLVTNNMPENTAFLVVIFSKVMVIVGAIFGVFCHFLLNSLDYP